MVTDYKIWQSETLFGPQNAALRLIYAAWVDEAPLDRDRLIFRLVSAGNDPHRASFAFRKLVESQLVSEEGARYLPTLKGAIALVEIEPLARRDLDALEALIAYAHRVYDPDRAAIAPATVTAMLGLDERQLRRLLHFAGFRNAADAVYVPAQVLYWSTFEDFLDERVPRSFPREEPDPPIAISAAIEQVRWTGVGVYAAPTVLDLRAPITVLAGANAVGKTTALAALEIFRNLALNGVSAVTQWQYYLSPDAAEVSFGVIAELQRTGGARPEAVDWELTAPARGKMHVRSETLRRLRPIPGLLMQFERGTGRWHDEHGSLVEHNLAPDDLALASARSHTAHSQLVALRQNLKRWHVQLAVPGSPGADMTAWWSQYRADAAARDVLRAHARTLTGMDVDISGELVLIEPDGRRVRRPLASRGVVRAIELLALLFAPEPPTLIAIDEIENHLHGDLLARLIEVMRSVAHRTKIVLTTHSARALRCFDAAEIRVVRRAGDGSTIASIADDPRLARLIDVGDLGELIENGYFAGPP